MIRDAEIRRLARVAGVEPRTVELDYALGWALRGIAGHPCLGRRLVFKGGTCLRKCYFQDYRFSVDVDFTATQWFGWEEFRRGFRGARCFTKTSGRRYPPDPRTTSPPHESDSRDPPTAVNGRAMVPRSQRIAGGRRLTVMTGTSNSSNSTKATRPPGPKASGITRTSRAMVPT